MGRRRRRGGPPRLLPYDFVASFGATSKNVTCADLGLVRNRSMRPYRAHVTAAIVGATQMPALYLSLFDTKNDVVGISYNCVLGATARSVSVRVPRFTDFGDYHDDGSVVMTISLGNYYNGTATVAGTIWMQFAPHKVATKVSCVYLEGPFSDRPPKSDSTTSTDEGSKEDGASPPLLL